MKALRAALPGLFFTVYSSSELLEAVLHSTTSGCRNWCSCKLRLLPTAVLWRHYSKSSKGLRVGSGAIFIDTDGNIFFEHSSLDLVPPSTNFFDGFVPNPCSFPTEELPLPLPEVELCSAMTEFKVPELPQGGFDANNYQHEKKTNEKIITISVQSLAARERRRKITEKTQELGKLVPGGCKMCKMNTAEMLHAAGKYVQSCKP